MGSLSKLFTTILLFGLAFNVVAYLFNVYEFSPYYHFPVADLSTWQGWFNFDAWNLLFTGAALAGIGLVSLLTRSGTYAIYALLITALTMIIKPVQQFVTALPTTLGMLLPPETNPLGTGTNPIVVVVSTITVFAAFWWIFSLVTQREIS